ncbi:MAG: DNA polymerase III subunit gamma/tau [Erysipelotrichaceae bacterium]
MAYKALYRTYRPNSFETVIGQQHIVKTLQNAIAQNKISHAYLFCGPRGTGKTTVAKLVAKSVNCLNPEKAPCNQCEHCATIQAGIHPDVIEIDAASNNGVDEIRELIEKVKYAPLQGRFKVYIIDEVHMLSQGAFNALLKTLEEPPSHVIFILATTEPHKVLPTIISRCQRYDFVRVGKREIQHRIEEVLKLEKIGYEDEAVRLISQLADGGVRDALSILEQCIAYAQDDLKAIHVNEIYGIATTQDKLKLIEAVFDENVASLMGEIEAILQKNIDIKRLTNDLMEILKEAVIFHYTKDDSLINKLNREEAVGFLRIQPRILLGMIDDLMDTAEKYRSSANLVSYFEIGMLKLMNRINMKPTEELAQPKANVKEAMKPVMQAKIEPKTEGKPKPVINLTEEVKQPVDETPKPVVESPKIDVIKQETKEEKPKQEAQAFDGLIPSVIDFEFLLRLLVSADKDKRKSDEQSWSRIDNYTMDLVWARYANMLRGSQVVCSGDGYILVNVVYGATASELNSPDHEHMLAKFTNEILGKSHKLFAISDDEKVRLINLFIEKKKEGSLPQGIHILAPVLHAEIKESKPIEEEIPNSLFSLFGGEIDLVREEKK